MKTDRYLLNSSEIDYCVQFAKDVPMISNSKHGQARDFEKAQLQLIQGKLGECAMHGLFGKTAEFYPYNNQQVRDYKFAGKIYDGGKDFQNYDIDVKTALVTTGSFLANEPFYLTKSYYPEGKKYVAAWIVGKDFYNVMNDLNNPEKELWVGYGGWTTASPMRTGGNKYNQFSRLLNYHELCSASSPLFM